MKITYNNYEEYIIDYIEGNLSEELQAEMELFFSVNPEIQSDLIDFSEYKMKPENSHFSEKDLMKKENFDYKNDNKVFTEFCVAKLEEDLSQKDLDEFTNFLDFNPPENYEYSLYRKTKLNAETIQFPEKKKLKKINLQFIKTKYIIYSSAAIIILGLISPVILQDIISVYTSAHYQNFNSTQKENMCNYFIISSKIVEYSPQIEAIKHNSKISDFINPLPKTKAVVHQEIIKDKSRKDILSTHDTISEFAIIEPPQQRKILFDSFSSHNSNMRENFNIDTSIVAKDLEAEHYLTLKQHLAQRVSEKIPIDLRKSSSIKKPHLINIVKAGIKGYNTIFNKDIVVKQEFWKNGKRKMLAIKTDKFQIIKYY